MLDPKQTPLYTPTADDTPPTITITPSLTIDAHSVTGSIVQSVWDNHKTSVNTGTAPRDLGVHFENDGGDEKMQGLDARDRHEQPISSVAAGPTSPALDRAYVSAAIPVTPATAPADDLEDHKVPTSPAFEVRTTEDPPVAGEVTTSTSEPGSIKAPSSAEEKDKPLRQGYDVTTGTFYYFHEATPPPKPEQVEDVHEDVTMNEDEDEDGEEEKSRGSASEPERSSSPPSSALPGLMRTRRRPRISYAEPYSMRDSESRSPSPTGQPRTRRISIPKRVYGKRGSRQLPGPDGCPPPPSLRGGMTPKDCYLPLIPTNIQPVEGIKQMTMEQKTQLALQLGGRPLRKKELVYVMERMDPDLKNNTDRGWLNTLSQGNSIRKSTKSKKPKTEIGTPVVSLESDYVTGFFWWLPDTPHQCKPDNLFRERQGNNRRMDFRFSTLSTPMEGVEKSTRTERPCGSIALPLEEEEDE